MDRLRHCYSVYYILLWLKVSRISTCPLMNKIKVLLQCLLYTTVTESVQTLLACMPICEQGKVLCFGLGMATSFRHIISVSFFSLAQGELSRVSSQSVPLRLPPSLLPTACCRDIRQQLGLHLPQLQRLPLQTGESSSLFTQVGLHLSSNKWVFISLQTNGSSFLLKQVCLHLSWNRWVFISLHTGRSSSVTSIAAWSSNRWVFISFQTGGSSSLFTHVGLHLASNRWVFIFFSHRRVFISLQLFKQVSLHLSSNRWVFISLEIGGSSSVLKQVSLHLSSHRWFFVYYIYSGSIFKQVGLHLV